MSGRSNGLPPTGNGYSTPFYTPSETPNQNRSQSRQPSRSATPGSEASTDPRFQQLQHQSPRRGNGTSRTNSVRSSRGGGITEGMGNMRLTSEPPRVQNPLDQVTPQEFARELTHALERVESGDTGSVHSGSSDEEFHDALDAPYVSPQVSRTQSHVSTRVPTPHIPTPRIPTPNVLSPVQSTRSSASSAIQQGPRGSASGGGFEAVSHFAHQMATCFIPTFAREFGAEAAATFLHDHRFVQVAVSAAVVLARVGGDYRRSAELNNYIEEAARNGHGLTPNQWGALTGGERERLINRTREQNTGVRIMQHLSGILSLGLTVAGAVAGDRVPGLADLGATATANELRNVIYAFMRDGENASMSSVSVRPGGDGQSARTNRERMNTSAGVYGGTQAAGSLVSGYAGAAYNSAMGVHLSGQVARNAAGQLLGGGEFARHIAGVGAIRAGVNTMIETFEAWLQARHQAEQTGGVQQMNWGTNNDFRRLGDHSVTRVAWNGIGSLMGQTTGLLGLAHTFSGQQHVQQGLNAIGQALAFGLSYVSINHTYQAHAGVRGQIRNERRGTDEEQGGIGLDTPRSSTSTRRSGDDRRVSPQVTPRRSESVREPAVRGDSSRGGSSDRGDGSSRASTSSSTTYYSYQSSTRSRRPGEEDR